MAAFCFLKMFRVLFHRDYQGFTGGHLKLADYVRHVDASSFCQAQIHVTPASSRDHLWIDHPRLISSYDPLNADLLFIAGLDWLALQDYNGIEAAKPVINLVQGLRHADPDHLLFSFLEKRAVRICVSDEVAAALSSTGKCNGPIHTITNCIDHALLPADKHYLASKVVILGVKQPELARQLEQSLGEHDLAPLCITTPLPRQTLLEISRDAHVIVTLPTASEGFYLPALEAMAMRRAVVCTDCIGNRGFCRDDDTCLMPANDLSSLTAAVLRLLRDEQLVSRLQDRGYAQSLQHRIEQERQQFQALLADIVTSVT
jgi:hypothetical protein